MVVVAQILALGVADVGPTRAFTLEGGERSARVRGDPHVNHRDADSAEGRSGRALPVGVQHTGHHRTPLGVVAEAQIVVDVPLHQRPGEVGQRRIVDGHSDVGHEHGRHERALRALGLVHERLGGAGVEELAVDDETTIHEVFVAGALVADGHPALGHGIVVIRPLGKHLEGVLDQLSRAFLLLGRHALDATDVDSGGGVVGARPIGEMRMGVGGNGDGTVDVDHRHGGRAAVIVRLRFVDDVARGVDRRMIVNVRTAGPHGGNHEHRTGHRRVRETHRGKRTGSDEHGGQCRGGGDGTEAGTDGVGPLRALGDLESVDPRDARDAREQPSADGGTVDEHAGRNECDAGSEQHEESPAHLEQGHHDEDAGQLRMFGVQADGSTVDDAGGQRGQSGDGDSGMTVHALTLQMRARATRARERQ